MGSADLGERGIGHLAPHFRGRFQHDAHSNQRNEEAYPGHRKQHRVQSHNGRSIEKVRGGHGGQIRSQQANKMPLNSCCRIRVVAVLVESCRCFQPSATPLRVRGTQPNATTSSGNLTEARSATCEATFQPPLLHECWPRCTYPEIVLICPPRSLQRGEFRVSLPASSPRRAKPSCHHVG